MTTLNLTADDSALFALNHMLTGLAEQIIDAGYPDKLVGPLGEQGVQYIGEDDGVYASLSLDLPEGVFAEIDRDTYGSLSGVRVLLASGGRTAEISEGEYELTLSRNEIDVRDEDGNHVNDASQGDEMFTEWLGAIVDANR